MKLEGGLWVKIGDVKHGDLIKIKDEGEKKLSKFKTPDGLDKYQYNFKVELPDGSNKIMTINRTSLNMLGEKWGRETRTWVDKLAKVYIATSPLGKEFILLKPIGLEEGAEENLPF